METTGFFLENEEDHQKDVGSLLLLNWSFRGRGLKSNLALKAICFGILQKSQFHIILK